MAAPPPVPQLHPHLDALSDDEDGDVCRICRMGASEDGPLYWPCRCSGSIKYVHERCLIEWLQHSGRLQAGAACEVRAGAGRLCTANGALV
jgi:E3 ubiquitin-protein ligase MARCH6